MLFLLILKVIVVLIKM